MKIEHHTADLPCYDGHKSFYGKAVIIDGGSGWRLLKSYDTIVCGIDGKGVFHRFWDGYSVTTMRHINSFCYMYSLPYSGKAWWCGLVVEN